MMMAAVPGLRFGELRTSSRVAAEASDKTVAQDIICEQPICSPVL